MSLTPTSCDPNLSWPLFEQYALVKWEFFTSPGPSEVLGSWVAHVSPRLRALSERDDVPRHECHGSTASPDAFAWQAVASGPGVSMVFETPTPRHYPQGVRPVQCEQPATPR